MKVEDIERAFAALPLPERERIAVRHLPIESVARIFGLQFGTEPLERVLEALREATERNETNC